MLSMKWILCGVLLNIYLCEGYRILAVFPLPSKSHGILGDNMVKLLLEAGHEVTYVTPFMTKDVHPKLQQIDVSSNKKIFNENSLNVKMIMDGAINFQDADFLSYLFIGMGQHTLENPNVQKFIRDPKQKFDVVIAEWMFSELYSVFATVFDCPLIWLSTIEPHWIILNLIDGPSNPAYTVDSQSRCSPPLSFSERVSELWIQVSGLFKRNFKYYYQEENIYKRLIIPALTEKGNPVPSYDDIRYNASLILGNTQMALGEGNSLPQSYQHIGGYHIDEEVKPLPEDLKIIFDNAKNGVIYFSMGSNIKSKDLPKELKEGILKVFSGLKQTVIWKFEEVLSDLPKNVHIVQWAPQQSILAHPKTVLFITHGGLLSQTESIFFGVPVISIPVFADQFVNAERAEKKGIGKKVDLTYTMFEDLKEALNELLNNPKYTEKTKQLAAALHDIPMKPKDALSFWVSHVVRTHGAAHLRSPALQIPLYQRLYLDLAAVIILLILVLKTIVKRLISLGVKICSKKEKPL